MVEYWLKPSGMTLRQLTVEHPEGLFFDTKKYGRLRSGNFRTPSGKIELYSQTLADAGFDPLPAPVEPSDSPLSTPELAQEYPIILITGSRHIQYTHAQMRNVPSLRKLNPEPVAAVHPETAEKYGVADGDLITVATKDAAIKIKLKTTPDLMPGVLSLPHGWAEANCNPLTRLEPRDPITGYSQFRGLSCRIQKA